MIQVGIEYLKNKLNMGMKLFGPKMGRLLNPYFTMDYTFAFEQDDPADFEKSSPDYSLFHLGGGVEIPAGNQRILLSIVVSNLFDEEYIDHLSTLRDLGYSNAGRNVMVNLVVPFGIKKSKE
jgi:iron complex outermembrane receptor protein